MQSLEMEKAYYPEIGSLRVWEEEFINLRLSSLPSLSWKKLGKLASANLNEGLEAPGIYCFVRRSKIDEITPYESGFPLVVYIGKAKRIGTRLEEYIKDKKSIALHRSSERAVRSGIKTMFREYNDNLIIYYSFVEPSQLDSVESTLIQLFDPIFNEAQKLDSIDFDQYNEVVTAHLDESYSAFEAPPKEKEAKMDFAATAEVGTPQPAF